MSYSSYDHDNLETADTMKIGRVKIFSHFSLQALA